MEAEILFLRRQLALYRERGAKPKRIDAATRVTLTFLSRWFDWRRGATIVREPFDVPPISRRIAFFSDPWGNLFELIQRIDV